ncbi:MAG: MgtC/SapB family protein [Proteobacteria bacterium]|nr:MgtC/SapB family protein [Pseudomonadota bacterium]
MSGVLPSAVDLSDIALRLVAAVVVGMIVGLDREWRGRTVGIRTLGLVSLGSALVCLATIHYAPIAVDVAATSRVIQGVIQGVMTGIGFIGAGAILKSQRPQQQAHGLTTAATVWVTAALGIACALATWMIVLIGIGLTLIVLVLLHPIDLWFDRHREDQGS